MENIKRYMKENAYMAAFWILVATLAATALIHTINMNDYYWHVKAGEYMAKFGEIPKTGIFSWYALENSLPWIAHEWLFEYLIYHLSEVFGGAGAILYTFLTSFILVFILAWNSRKDILNIYSLVGFIWLGLGIFSVLSIQSPRPHMLMFIFMALLMNLLYYYKKNPDTKLIYLMPLLSLLWVNIHGGSSNMIYLLPLMFMGAHMFEFKIGGMVGEKIEKRQLIKLLLLTLLSASLLLLNPNGYEMLIYPYVNMGDSLMLHMIQEWKSADAKVIAELVVIFVPIALHVIVLAIKNKGIRLHDLLFFAFFTFMSLRSIRFAYLIYFIQSLSLFQDFPREKAPRKDNKLIPVFLILATMLVFIRVTIINEFGTVTYLSDEMIERVVEEKPERLLNDYSLGGYLIYHDIPVYIDGRADMYSKYNLHDYFRFDGFFREDTDEFLEENRFDYILLLKNATVNNYLKRNDGWEIIEEDDYAFLYKKAVE